MHQDGKIPLWSGLATSGTGESHFGSNEKKTILSVGQGISKPGREGVRQKTTRYRETDPITGVPRNTCLWVLALLSNGNRQADPVRIKKTPEPPVSPSAPRQKKTILKSYFEQRRQGGTPGVTIPDPARGGEPLTYHKNQTPGRWAVRRKDPSSRKITNGVRARQLVDVPNQSVPRKKKWVTRPSAKMKGLCCKLSQR